MSDLISRSELLKHLITKNIQITFDLSVEEVLARLVKDAVQANNKMVIDTIKNQPTAYPVDKDVKELEKERKNGNISIDIGEYRVFEIVKRGGVGKVVE